MRPMSRSTGLAASSAVLMAGLLLMPAASLAQDASTAPADRSLDLAPTPSQAEGPFYPLEIPSDHDDDLTVVEGTGQVAQGTPLLVEGLLLDAAGDPVEGAVIEIWQTDANGIYLHPGDPDFAERDAAFQGYGESSTDAAGAWSFRTILPDVYGGRPRHIHAKVRLDGTELLTTQIYFADVGVPLEGAVSPTGTELDRLIVSLEESTADDGSTQYRAQHLIVLP